ncbi:MAG: response regulator [Phycisphaerae bacterium]
MPKSQVLIVDDEPDSSEFVAKYLAHEGFRTQLAPNGRDALATLINTTPDALVLDVRMPGMDGIELLQILRSYLRWKDLPVIILTAHANEAQEDMVRYLGVRRVFRKANFKLSELAEEIRTALGPHEGRRNA